MTTRQEAIFLGQRDARDWMERGDPQFPVYRDVGNDLERAYREAFADECIAYSGKRAMSFPEVPS